ncbi:MAG TPA: PBP1A family penicillin-binding protein [Thermoanaerobaculia bacterium]|nr:PBP1A family penicillin-binding protein [Thermoanaerobaculia bacterium]
MSRKTQYAVRPAPEDRRRRARRLLLVLATFALLAGLVLWPFWRLAGQFDDLTYLQPSRLYAAPVRLYDGRAMSRDRLVRELAADGYQEDEGAEPLPGGTYRRSRNGVAVRLREFLTPEGAPGSGLLEVTFRGSRVAKVVKDGAPVAAAWLEPPLVNTFYGPDHEERRPVALAAVPDDLVAAVLAAEDDGFFRHPGVSLSGIARAAWVNFRGGEVKQGGSTLTQQLVKNLYLTHERTFVRKGQELVLALLLELRYGKPAILEAYLNEIYLGAAGGVNLLGVGAAARGFFGKDASQLELHEAATLAGIIRAPAPYSPLVHPEAAQARRDWVLHRLAALGRVDRERIERALAAPLGVAPSPVFRRRAPYFADAMAAEAERRYGIDTLEDGGFSLFSTLGWSDQRAAQKAVEDGLAAVEKAYERRSKAKGPLQAALVSLDPRTGGILAYVGGRQYGASQFDRAGRAERQAGSAFKPVVYAAAFENGRATPASFLEDSPLTVRLAGRPWRPKNDDGSFHDWVTVRTALERSYNPATARLALQVGIERVVALANDLGVEGELAPNPSVALGAAEVTPLELATVFATLAAGGIRPPVHGLVAVYDRYGKPVTGAELPERRRVLSSQTAYLLTSILQGVVDRGTGRGVRSWGVRGEVAGKTGTTNDRRDSWFVGYSPNRASAVWVGYDDNSPTRLSGARGAVPIWGRFAKAVAPAGGYPAFDQPAGIATAVIDPTTGLLATEFCPYVLTEVFRSGNVPDEVCDRHRGWSDEWAVFDDVGDAIDEAADEADRAGPRERRHPIRRWFKKVFGNDDEDEEEGRDEEGERRDEEEPPFH